MNMNFDKFMRSVQCARWHIRFLSHSSEIQFMSFMIMHPAIKSQFMVASIVLAFLWNIIFEIEHIKYAHAIDAC